MFDKLVESTKQKQGRRAGRYFAITCAVYAVALAALGVGTILTFSPVLAEEYGLMARLIPPPPPPGKPQAPEPERRNPTPEPAQGFIVPKKAVVIPPADEVPQKPLVVAYNNKAVDGVPYGFGHDRGVPGGNGDADPPPPPPPPKPSPTAAPEPAPKPPQTQKVSEGVLQGKAIHRVKPAYPPIARTGRTSGMVQIQVTISEQGRVIEAVVLSGPPLLRAASLDAARQWVFSPTTLSNVPVKVQGILTFNFTLE